MKQVIKVGNMAEKRYITWDSNNSLFKVGLERGRRFIHVAYFKDIKEAELLSGLISNVMMFHDLSNVECIRTYVLTRFENIKRLIDEDAIEQEKTKYKKKRKYLSMKDIYGSDGGGERSEFDYSKTFQDRLDNTDTDDLV